LSKHLIHYSDSYFWQIGSIDAISDLIIALAYYPIPVMLVYYVRAKRETPFDVNVHSIHYCL
jgi:hypothetical protein